MSRVEQDIAAMAARVAACLLFSATTAQAATITVNSLADDVFPNAVGAIFQADDVTPVVLASPKCTLRMAIASANLDPLPGNEVGGPAFGCAAGLGADTIVFDAALGLASTPGTITLANKAMSEAPAVFSPTPNTTNALVVSRPLIITGPGSTQLTIDGGATQVNPAGLRLLVAGDGDDNADRPFVLGGMRFYRGRNIDRAGGCMFSTESLTLDDVTFENCESVGGASGAGSGGALGVGNLSAGTAVPAVSITNSRFLGNRAVRGTPPFTGVGPASDARRPDNGGAGIGSGARKVGAVTLTNVLFNGNSAERHGAMLIQNAASVLISGSHFIGNAATGVDPFVNNSMLTSNGSGRFGGFRVIDVSGDVTINNATRVNSNVAHEERAGFGVASVAGTVTINEVDVTGNYVNRGRIGGFEVLTDTFDPVTSNCLGLQLRPVTISQIRVQGNSVASNVGGLRILCSGAVTMTDVWIVGNETRGYRIAPADVVSTSNSAAQFGNATDGTAASSTLALTDVLVENNSTDATAGGGGSQAVVVSGLGAFTADSLRLVNNFMAGGIGLSLQANGVGRNYVVSNSEFSGNNALGSPALFIQTDGNYTVRNSTVSGNTGRTGPGSSGRIIGVNANTNTMNGINIAIEHSTIARNTAPSNEALSVFVAANSPNPGTVSGLYGGGNTAISVKNSILGTRAPGSGGISTVTIDAGVTNVTATNSLLEYTGGAPALASFCAGTGMKCNVGSLVSPIANNGGSNDTRTMALMAGSPAINAGGAVLGGLTTDQRGAGFPRVVGAAVDMGAFEADPATTFGCTLDIDGNGVRDALTDGLLLIRALFGLTGTAVTNNAIGTSPTRGTWAAIQSYLNANCGSTLAP